jgi:hypothetical protein
MVLHRVLAPILSACIASVLISGTGIAQTVSDTTSVPCNQSSSWFAVDFATRVLLPVVATKVPGTFRKGTGSVELKYTRTNGSVPSLATQVVLTNLHAITIDLWSKEDSVLVAFVKDQDGATFNRMISLKAGEWQQVMLTPTDFALNADSPVKKSVLELERLGAGLMIADLATLTGKTGPNILRIDNLIVERGTLEVVDLPQTLDGKTLAITKDSLLKGSTTIKNGGRLQITTPRAVIAGSIDVANGELSVTGTVLTMQGRFAHDLALSAEGDSLIHFDKCLFASPYMSIVHLYGKSRLEMKETEFSGANFTADPKDNSSVDLDRVKQIGEFMLYPGPQYSIRACEEVILWMVPSGADQKRFTLPDGASLSDYSLSAKTGLNVHVLNSKGIKWGLISSTGTNIAVEGSKLVAVGLLFVGNAKETVTGVKNKQPMTDYKLNVSDRTLSFAGSSVGVWNVYAEQNSDIALKNCVVGEAFTTEFGKMTLENCTADGSGGYVRSSGKSMKFSKCKITCDVIADHNSDLILEDCDVVGSIHAIDQSTVHLIRTRVSGSTSSLDKAHITKA